MIRLHAMEKDLCSPPFQLLLLWVWSADRNSDAFAPTTDDDFSEQARETEDR